MICETAQMMSFSSTRAFADAVRRQPIVFTGRNCCIVLGSWLTDSGSVRSEAQAFPGCSKINPYAANVLVASHGELANRWLSSKLRLGADYVQHVFCCCLRR